MKLRRDHIETLFPSASQVFMGSVKSENFRKVGEKEILEVHEEGGYREVHQWDFRGDKSFNGIVVIKKRGKDIIAELYS